MTSLLGKLNLRPNELRLVVVVSSVVIAVLYFLFVWPQFAEWQKLQQKKTDLKKALAGFQKEIQKTAQYQKDLAALKEKGEAVDAEAQALEMQRFVTSQAALNGVSLGGYTPGRGAASGSGKTNAWFEEQSGSINFTAEESALVNFLYALSSGKSLIRVSSMTLNTDPSRMRLMGNLTLVASYPKKAPLKGAAGPAKPGPMPPGLAPAPKSISAAVSATARSGVTNKPASVSWWGKVKSIFSSSKSTNALVRATNAPVKKTPAPTNAPPRKLPTSK